MKTHWKRGISLIEIIVVMAIICIILTFGMIFNFDTFKAYYFRSERSTIVSILERARSKAMNNYMQSPHGVCYIAPNYVIFQGTTCTPGASTNELISANSNIASASNFSTTFPTIVFDQLTGKTGGGSVTVTDGVKSGTITINNEGTIAW